MLFQSSTDNLLANSGSLVFSVSATELLLSLNASQFFSSDFTIQRLCVNSNSQVNILLEDPATAMTVPTPFPGFPVVTLGLLTVRNSIKTKLVIEDVAFHSLSCSQFRSASDLECVCMDLNSTTTVLTLFFIDSLFTISDLLLVACTGECHRVSNRRVVKQCVNFELQRMNLQQQQPLQRPQQQDLQPLLAQLRPLDRLRPPARESRPRRADRARPRVLPRRLVARAERRSAARAPSGVACCRAPRASRPSTARDPSGRARRAR